MIRINLLPYRDEARKAKRKQFYSLTVLISILAALVVFAGYTLLGGILSNQQSKNDFLQSKIDGLSKQIDEIKKLEEQTQAVMNRKGAIESLQKNRGEAVHLLDELAKQTPGGVYLRSIKQTGAVVTVVGYAQSNAKISSFMRNIEASEWIAAPHLVEVKAVMVDGRRQNEFSMDFSMVRQVAPEEGFKSGGAKK